MVPPEMLTCTSTAFETVPASGSPAPVTPPAPAANRPVSMFLALFFPSVSRGPMVPPLTLISMSGRPSGVLLDDLKRESTLRSALPV